MNLESNIKIHLSLLSRPGTSIYNHSTINPRKPGCITKSCISSSNSPNHLQSSTNNLIKRNNSQGILGYKLKFIESNSNLSNGELDLNKIYMTSSRSKYPQAPHKTKNSASNQYYLPFSITPTINKHRYHHKIISQAIDSSSDIGTSEIFSIKSPIQSIIPNNDIIGRHSLNDKENANLSNNNNNTKSRIFLPVEESKNSKSNNTNTNNDKGQIFLKNSSCSSSSYLYKRKSSRRRRSIDAMNHISDFYDKAQINRALSKIDDTNERVKMLDMILKRREEMKILEDQERLVKVAPLLKKFANKVKFRLKSGNFHHFHSRLSFHRDTKINDNEVKSENLIENNKSDVISGISGCNKDISNFKLPENLDEKDNSEQILSGTNYSPESKKSTATTTTTTTATTRTISQSNNESKFKFFLMKKTPKNHQENELDEMLMAHVGSSMKKVNFNKAKEEEEDPLKGHFDTARKTVEKDLYNYLVKNKSMPEVKFFLGDHHENININSENPMKKLRDKEYKIQIIEANVKEKLDQHLKLCFKNMYRPLNMKTSSNELIKIPVNMINNHHSIQVIKPTYKSSIHPPEIDTNLINSIEIPSLERTIPANNPQLLPPLENRLEKQDMNMLPNALSTKRRCMNRLSFRIVKSQQFSIDVYSNNKDMRISSRLMYQAKA